MHALHATQPILEAVLLQARRAADVQIREVRLVIGELSPFTEDAVESCWESIAQGTPAEGAKLYFRRSPAEVQCMVCFGKYHPKGGQLICPNCGSVGAKILMGEEFYLDKVVLDEK